MKTLIVSMVMGLAGVGGAFGGLLVGAPTGICLVAYAIGLASLAAYAVALTRHEWR